MTEIIQNLVAAAPVILSLVILEGLLSIDNALVRASMISHLEDEADRKWAMRAGLVLAYALRGISLLFVTFLIANPWVKVLGAGYLIYLTCSHLGITSGKKDEIKASPATLWATIGAMSVAELAFSIDNVIAAAALSPKLWVIFTGVFIGIVTVQLATGVSLKLIKRFPVLDQVAYAIVGYIGMQIMAEHFLHIELPEVAKFSVIIGIIVAGLAYERFASLQRLTQPLFTWLGLLMGHAASFVEVLFAPLMAVVRAIFALFKRKS